MIFWKQKLFFLEKENSFLRSEIQNNQDTIQKLLKNNTSLVESINTNLILPTQQNKTDFIKSARHEKENKDLNLSRKIETSETISSSNAKMRDHQEKKNRNKKSRRHICIINHKVVKFWHFTNINFANRPKKDFSRPLTFANGQINPLLPNVPF